MFDLHRLAILGAVLSGMVLTPPVPARRHPNFPGAWATEPDLCSRVFTKKGNEVAFAELSDLFGSGFIIEGNRIRGKSARCTITSRKQDGDNLELGAACATSIMRSNVLFTLKVIDDSHLTRLFPDIQGMMLKYTRCSL